MSRPLRFLHLTTFYPPYHFGGDAVYVRRLAHALANRLGPLAPLVAHQTGGPLLDRRRLAGILSGSDWDVIHYHNISLLGPRILALAPPRGRPVKLYTAHEHWLVCPMHVLWKFGSRPCEKAECLPCVLHGRRPPQAWRYTSLLERSSRYVDRFFAPSRFTCRMHAERGFPQPLACLPYFVERVDREWREPGPRPHPRPYFLFVGRLEPVKGIDELIALWPEVEEADLLVAGDGSLAGELRAQAAGNPRIRFLGWVPQGGLGPFYRHAIACLIPSRTFETFGMVAIEAYSRKTPIVARNLGALPELVGEGGGIVYETRAELRAALARLAGTQDLRDELGERGYRAFLRLWSREAHLAAYLGTSEKIREGRDTAGFDTPE